MSARVRKSAGVPVRTPAAGWDRSGCREQVCVCHDAPPYVNACRWCGCRPAAPKRTYVVEIEMDTTAPVDVSDLALAVEIRVGAAFRCNVEATVWDSREAYINGGAA